MAISTNKAWYNKCFVSVAQKNGSEVQLTAKTTNLQITGMNFDLESVDTFKGQIKRPGRREDIEITFEGIPTGVQSFDWIFHGATSSATSITTSTIKDYRITFLWTDQTGITSATQAIDTSSEAYRHIYAEANCTALEYEMAAGEHLRVPTFTFRLAYEDDTGSLNWKKEECDTSSALSAVPAYTSAVKF